MRKPTTASAAPEGTRATRVKRGTPQRSLKVRSLRPPRSPVRKMVATHPPIPLSVTVLSTRRPGLARTLWLRGKGYISWALLLSVALLDPGLILAVLFVAVVAAVSVFCLGVIATSITTVALLGQWFPRHIKPILLTPKSRRS